MGTLTKIIPSRRTERIAYAIRDIVCVAQRRKQERGWGSYIFKYWRSHSIRF